MTLLMFINFTKRVHLNMYLCIHFHTSNKILETTVNIIDCKSTKCSQSHHCFNPNNNSQFIYYQIILQFLNYNSLWTWLYRNSSWSCSHGILNIQIFTCSEVTCPSLSVRLATVKHLSFFSQDTAISKGQSPSAPCDSSFRKSNMLPYYQTSVCFIYILYIKEIDSFKKR